MSEASYHRIRDRIAHLAPKLEIVTVPELNRFVRNGIDLAAGDIAPEIVWNTQEAYQGGLLPTLMRALLDSPSVRWLQTFNAGLDLPIFRRIMEKGVRITKSSAQGVVIAEYVLAHALSLIVPIDAQKALQARREWGRTQYREVSQTRWLLVGYGAIGEQIAQRARAFGVDLTVVRRGSDASHPAPVPDCRSPSGHRCGRARLRLDGRDPGHVQRRLFCGPQARRHPDQHRPGRVGG